MDLETFLVTVYVMVDDWYIEHVKALKPKRGAPPRMSDSEVLTLALAGQWRVGVPWRSERGLLRHMRQHYRYLFPTLLRRSAFNQRVRYMWGVFVQLQQEVAKWLESPDELYECVDCLPIPAFSSGQAQRKTGHWLWTATAGRGAGNWFYGDHLLASVRPGGAVTGWLLGSAHINDRWLLEAFLSSRAGTPRLQGPTPQSPRQGRGPVTPPVAPIGPSQAAGTGAARPYLADKGFNGARWLNHWKSNYQATVIAVPFDKSVTERPWSALEKRWLASHRQIVETAFAWLDDVFDIKHLNAHSRWGQFARVAAKLAAYNLGLFINRMLDRPAGSLATLLC